MKARTFPGTPPDQLSSAMGVQIIPEQPQLLLDRLVRKTEEKGAGFGFMAMRVPGRHDKCVLFLPVEDLIADAGTSFTLDNGINPGRSGLIGFTRKAFWEFLDIGPDCWHDGSTGRRIYIFKLDSLVTVDFVTQLEFLERFACPGVRVVEHG